MGKRHDLLFCEYAKDLQRAKLAAERWWKDLAVAETRKIGDPKAAAASIKRRWPLGAPSHPYVVAVLRQYWVACEALNLEVEEGEASSDDESISEIIFLSEFLLDGKHEKLAAFIAPLNYWPIGMEDTG